MLILPHKEPSELVFLLLFVYLILILLYLICICYRLGATEPKVSKLVSEPIGAEPKVVEDQLNRARALNNEIIANGKLIEDAKAAANNLLGSLDDSQMSPQERRQIEQTPKELQDRYDALKVCRLGLIFFQ